jgi:Acyl-coenzyme A:6-aminopenicillanic acid acyl-transferase
VFTVLAACAPATAPALRESIEVRGTPYARGLSHGTQLRSKIHSFYTTLLTNSLFPYLSREQADIASFLPEYADERYQHGQFAYQLLLDSAHSVEKSLPRAVHEELQGVADGSGLSYDEVLVLNTFLDTVLAVRGVALAIRLSRAPVVESIEFVGADRDGVDNSGEGQVDEPGEGTFAPWVPRLAGQLVEVSAGTTIRVVLSDPDGVDPATVRVSLGEQLFTEGSPGLTLTSLSVDRLQLELTTALPAASATTLVISAGDRAIRDTPPPAHASFMRTEELVFTTRGAGLALRDVRRPALTDNRTRPAPFALGVRGAATRGAQAFLATHFALLDANTSHRHTALIVHHPESGPAFATIGWAGMVYGLSGLSSNGVGYACSPSDTLDNSVVGSVFEQVADLSKATLVAKGTPIGFAGRKVLEQATDVDGAVAVMQGLKHVYGWSCVFGDASGALRGVEVDSDIFKSGSGGVFAFAPEDQLSSVRADDLVAGSSYSKNVVDSVSLTIAGQRLVPQRSWSGFYFRSRRVIDAVARRLDAQYGQLDVESLQTMLADPAVVDRSDSMNAVVLDLAQRTVHAAMGTVPATDSPFEATQVTP